VSDVSDEDATRIPAKILAKMSATSSACRAHVASWTGKSPRPTRTTCCGHPREDVTRMLRGKWSRGNSTRACVCQLSVPHWIHHTVDPL